MFIKNLKAGVPPIFIIAIRRLRSNTISPNKLFDGDDVLFKDEVKKVDVYGEVVLLFRTGLRLS